MNKRQKKTYTLRCKKCNKEYSLLITENLFLKEKFKAFCSRKCANSRDKKFSVRNKTSNSAIKWHSENKELFKERIKKRGLKFIIAYDLSPKKCIVCDVKISYDNRLRKTCTNNCRSEFLKQRGLLRLNGGGNGKRGKYKGFRLDSTYELAYLIYHLDHNIPIKRCDLKIPYFYKDKNHTYNPDFEVGNIIIEIKGYMNKRGTAKLAAALEQGFNIKLIDNNSIKPYIKYVQEKYNIKDLSFLYE